MDLPLIIPAHLVPPLLSREEVENFRKELISMWVECVEEYFDESYAKRTHHNARTYQHGCRGPLCTAANRAQTRSRHGHVATGKFAILDPIIEHFFDTIQHEEQRSQSGLMESLLGQKTTKI